jgi:hypothetical protein
MTHAPKNIYKKTLYFRPVMEKDPDADSRSPGPLVHSLETKGVECYEGELPGGQFMRHLPWQVIAESGSDVCFITYSSLVSLCSNFRNSYQLLLLTSSINYKSSVAPGRRFNKYSAIGHSYR